MVMARLTLQWLLRADIELGHLGRKFRTAHIILAGCFNHRLLLVVVYGAKMRKEALGK